MMKFMESDAISNSPRRSIRLTRGGMIYLALTGFVLIATLNSGVNLLYFLFGIFVGVPIVSLLVSSWTLRRISVERDFGSHVIAGDRTDIEYRIRSRKRFWPTMALHFRENHAELSEAPAGFVLHIPPHDSTPVIVATHLTARRRGMIQLRTIEIATSFPFGLIRRTRRLDVPQEMVVYPRIGMLNRHLALEYREAVESGAMTSNRRGGNDEFYGVREYRAGDNIRSIHWRSSARSGELMIREMAANAPPQLIVVLNLRSWRDRTDGPEKLERAIELAAALICYGYFENFAVGLAIAGLEDAAVVAPRMGRDARGAMLRQLALIDPRRINASKGIDFPNRIAGRAEWVAITLHGEDAIRDLLPPSSGGAQSMGHRTTLALDDSQAGSWIHFLSTEETHRLLREHT
jgi:uncharacterized protein (DUF58 family)